MKAPWWDNLATEFFTENLVPFTLRDEREFKYELTPARPPRADDLQNRAEQLRSEARIQPKPRRGGILGWLGFELTRCRDLTRRKGLAYRFSRTVRQILKNCLKPLESTRPMERSRARRHSGRRPAPDGRSLARSGRDRHEAIGLEPADSLGPPSSRTWR